MNYQRRLHLNHLKNDYFTVIFQTLLVIAFLTSLYPDWQNITRITLIVAACVAGGGSYIMKTGYFAFIFANKNRQLDFEGDSFKRLVRTARVCVS